MKTLNKNILLLLTILIFIIGCSSEVESSNKQTIDKDLEQIDNDFNQITNNVKSNNNNNNNNNIELTEDSINSNLISAFDSIELFDINSNKTFTISQFSDKPIFIESFAVWCPTCTRQQKIIKQLHEMDLDIEYTSISLNTDPNEDRIKISEHTERHGFDWIYVIAPEEITTYFISKFGIGFVSAPSVPIVLICPNKEPEFLKTGIKDTDYLIEKLKSCEVNS